MATNSPSAGEVLFYRVSCTDETDEWAPEAFPCVLVLPDESDPRSEVPPRRWAELRTEPGRWYRYLSRNRPHQVPLTEEQAEQFRVAGWIVEAPRPPRGAAERALADYRRSRLAEREEAPRREEAVLATCRESIRASEEERVKHLWSVRLRRKIPRELYPGIWWQVQADYVEQWCKTNSLKYERTLEHCEWAPWAGPNVRDPDGYCPDLDIVRCVVFGWAKGTDAESLERAVTQWHENLRPVLRWLWPITDGEQWPGPQSLGYVTEDFPRVRSEVAKALDEWPDSPPALAALLNDFDPIVDLLEAIEKHGTVETLAAIATADDLAALTRLSSRRTLLSQLLVEARAELQANGWKLDKSRRLKRTQVGVRGPKSGYLGTVIPGLYAYLRPIYEQTFRPQDFERHDEQLRLQISRLLSPFFSEKEISPHSKGPIANAIDNHLRTLRRGQPEPRVNEDAVGTR